jgi:hypothetical protein
MVPPTMQVAGCGMRMYVTPDADVQRRLGYGTGAFRVPSATPWPPYAATHPPEAPAASQVP